MSCWLRTRWSVVRIGPGAPIKSTSYAIFSYPAKNPFVTFSIDELIATKIRALFQRKKGRDLFDIARSIETLSLNVEAVLKCFSSYLDRDGIKISRADFEKNLHLKKTLNVFREDILPLLPVNSHHSFDKDFDLVMSTVITKLPGEPWKGARG